MDLIIATYKYLIVFNLIKNKYRIIHKGDGIYYGLAKYKDQIIVGKRNNPLKRELRYSNASFLFLNNKLEIIDEIIPHLSIRDLHGIKVFNDKLWATCAFDNMIAIYDFNKKNWSYWHPSLVNNNIKIVDDNLREKLKSNNNRGSKHFNTININKENINLAAHNFGDSEIYFFNINTLKFNKKIPIGLEIHNIWYKNDEIFTLSSGSGYVISNNKFKFNIGGYARGFCENDTRYFIGHCTSLEREERYLDSFMIKSFNHNFEDNKNYYFKDLGGVTDILYFDNLKYSL